MARQIGKDAPINMNTPGFKTTPKDYNKPSQKSVNIPTPAPSMGSKGGGSAPRFKGGAALNSPSPYHKQSGATGSSESIGKEKQGKVKTN